MNRFIFLSIIMNLLWLNNFAQDVQNIRVSQEGNRVNVLYDLSGTNELFKVSLHCTTDDGKSWKGPLKNVSGDVGININSGNNKLITWDVVAENVTTEGYMQFKVIADVVKPAKATQIPKTEVKLNENIAPNFKKYRTRKALTLTLAIASAGTGIYTYLEGNKLYDEYQSSGDDSSDLRTKIDLYDTIYPIAFAVAGASAITFAIIAGKHNKAKKQVSLQPVPLKKGGGLTATISF
jgi:hypothetical protein